VSDDEAGAGAAAGTLYVVATPIGNLEDVTLRALAVLRSVDVIACEDTRRTRVLLDRHGIEGTLIPFHKFNEAKAAAGIARRLLSGKSVALVSDGGTPAVSDPGYRLVRAALDGGAPVVPVPGPSAFVAAVSASGLPSEAVTFRGFLPHRAGERRRAIEAIAQDATTQVFYESPHRIAAAMDDLASVLGARPAAVVREMTKRFETWYRGTLVEIDAKIGAETARGEYCIVVEGARAKKRAPGASAGARAAAAGKASGGDETGDLSPEALRARLRKAYEKALAAGVERKEALKDAARACGVARKDAYILLKL
jgi:16S rRNA (cytidine1402-2'-O)-methyltransferase